MIKEFGLSLASAVFLDALVVRCLLLPAMLYLVGAATWWLPGVARAPAAALNIEGAAAGRRPRRQATGALQPRATPRARAGVATEGAEG